MPDWTYEPLRGVAAVLAGRRRSQRGALHTLASAVSVPGLGRAVVWVFGLRPPPPHLAGSVAGIAVRSRLGAVVPPRVLPHAARALPALGAGLIEVAPVAPDDLPRIRQAAAGRTVPFVVRTADPELAVGQLLLVITGVGLFVGGAVVSVYGQTSVFVPSDLVYLESSAEALRAASPRLLPFIAHDRAGFGGALMAAAAVITLLSAWGWRRGEAWVWWTLTLAAIVGFAPAIAVHGSIRYTDFGHLAPVYFGVILTTTALVLSRQYLCTRASCPPQPVRSPDIRRRGATGSALDL